MTETVWAFVFYKDAPNGGMEPLGDWFEIAPTAQAAMMQARVSWDSFKNTVPPGTKFAMANRVSMLTFIQFMMQSNFACGLKQVTDEGDPIIEVWHNMIVAQMQGQKVDYQQLFQKLIEEQVEA